MEMDSADAAKELIHRTTEADDDYNRSWWSRTGSLAGLCLSWLGAVGCICATESGSAEPSWVVDYTDVSETRTVHAAFHQHHHHHPYRIDGSDPLDDFEVGAKRSSDLQFQSHCGSRLLGVG